MALHNYYAKRFPRPRPFLFVKIIVKLRLRAFWQNFENGKMQKLFTRPLKIIFSKTTQQKFLDIAYKINSPWVCVIKVCSNGGATFIICEIIAKDNLNIVNLMQTFENLLLQNFLTDN